VIPVAHYCGSHDDAVCLIAVATNRSVQDH
jgi:hypothetical protein